MILHYSVQYRLTVSIFSHDKIYENKTNRSTVTKTIPIGLSNPLKKNQNHIGKFNDLKISRGGKVFILCHE
jgi:hypothetical protein